MSFCLILSQKCRNGLTREYANANDNFHKQPPSLPPHSHQQSDSEYMHRRLTKRSENYPPCVALSSIHELSIHLTLSLPHFFLFALLPSPIHIRPLSSGFLIYLIFVHFIRSICAPVALDNGHTECVREKFPLRHTCTLDWTWRNGACTRIVCAERRQRCVPHARRTN